MRIQITNIGVDDAYFEDREQLIGQTGLTEDGVTVIYDKPVYIHGQSIDVSFFYDISFDVLNECT